MSQELRLIRRITLKLIPFLILLYLIAYVDRHFAVSVAAPAHRQQLCVHAGRVHHAHDRELTRRS